MLRSISETYKDEVICNIIEFIKILKLKISKTDIRLRYYKKFKHRKNIKFSDLVAFFEFYSINTVWGKIDYSNLNKFSTPFFLIPNEFGSNNFKRKLLLVKHLNNEKAFVFEYSVNRYVYVNLSDLHNKDGFLVLLIKSFNKSIIDNYYQQNKKKERHQIDIYKQLIVTKELFSQKKCFEFIKEIEEAFTFSRSLVSKLDRNNQLITGYSDVRTSANTSVMNNASVGFFLNRLNNNSVIKVNNIEQVVCEKFEAGQEFQLHHDAMDGDSRYKTTYIFLNDNYSGGGIFFKELNYKIRPKTGTYLSFPNLDLRKKRIPESLYSLLPVKKGIKYILAIYETF